jgi:hypothetical protein
MQFCFDDGSPNRIWVDRADDGRLDHFQPCEVCFSMAQVRALEGQAWHDLSLCPPCRTDLAIEAPFTDALGILKPVRGEPPRVQIEPADVWRESLSTRQDDQSPADLRNHPW